MLTPPVRSLSTRSDRPWGHRRGFVGGFDEADRLGVLPWLLAFVIVTNRIIPAHVTLPIGLSLHPSELLMAITGAYLVLLHLNGRVSQMRGLPALIGVVVLVVHSFGPWLNAATLSASEIRTFDQGVVITYLYALTALAAYHCGKSQRATTLAVSAVILASAIQGSVAIVEGLTGQAFSFAHTVWQYFGLELDPRAAGGVSVNLNTRLTGELRSFSTAPHPLVLSAILGTTTLITTGRFLTATGTRARVMLGVALVVQAVGFAFANSRTGMIVVVAGAPLLAISVANRPKRLLALGGLAGALLGSIAVLSNDTLRILLDTFTLQQRDHNLDVRVARIPRIWDYLTERPFLGAGYHTHDATVGQLWDNAYMQALTELGMIGATMFVALILVWGSTAFRIPSISDDYRQIRFQTQLAAVAPLVAGLTLDAWTFDQFMPMCLILLALGVGRSQASTDVNPRATLPVHAEEHGPPL